MAVVTDVVSFTQQILPLPTSPIAELNPPHLHGEIFSHDLAEFAVQQTEGLLSSSSNQSLKQPYRSLKVEQGSLFVFPGPSLPSPAEIKMAALENSSLVFGVNGSALFKSAHLLGMQNLAVALTLHSYSSPNFIHEQGSRAQPLLYELLLSVIDKAKLPEPQSNFLKLSKSISPMEQKKIFDGMHLCLF